MSVHSCRKDRLYPRITKAVDNLLAVQDYVSPVQLLVEMELITKQQVEDWRFGRIPYLEMVVKGNLNRLSRLLQILQCQASDLNLKPSQTVYKRWGKGPKRALQFSKTADHKIEEAYAKHFVKVS